MLADPDFANLVQLIGIASLGADEKQIWHLTKLYWYSVEFGVVREGDDIKAFGAGILSSFGELRHMAAGGARLEPLDVFQPQPKMSYKVREVLGWAGHALRVWQASCEADMRLWGICMLGTARCVIMVDPCSLCLCLASAMSLQDGYQQRYAVLDSFAAGAEQLKAYCATLHHTIPLDVRIAVGLQ
jgi:hypothetical protein